MTNFSCLIFITLKKRLGKDLILLTYFILFWKEIMLERKQHVNNSFLMKKGMKNIVKEGKNLNFLI